MDAKKYLIVGGSSGIGLELVKELANRGNEIYVGSRTSDKLTGLPGVHHLRLDVAQPLIFWRVCRRRCTEWHTVRERSG